MKRHRPIAALCLLITCLLLSIATSGFGGGLNLAFNIAGRMGGGSSTSYIHGLASVKRDAIMYAFLPTSYPMHPQITDTLPAGSKVDFIRRSACGYWAKIRHGKREGWVLLHLLKPRPIQK